MLRPSADLETKATRKRCITARAALAELKQAAELIPNQSVLINTLPLFEHAWELKKTPWRCVPVRSISSVSSFLAQKVPPHCLFLNAGVCDAVLRKRSMNTTTRLPPLLALVALLGAPALTPASAALVQWTVAAGGNDHWYGVTSSIGSWDAMEAEAIASGGHLASIASAAENEFAYSLIPTDAGGPGNACWIGLSRATTVNWSWSDGSEFSFANWGNGEPNNASGQEYWVWMYGPPSGSAPWNDHNQWDYQLHGVIEVVPAPGALALFGLVGLRARRQRSLVAVTTARATAERI